MPISVTLYFVITPKWIERSWKLVSYLRFHKEVSNQKQNIPFRLWNIQTPGLVQTSSVGNLISSGIDLPLVLLSKEELLLIIFILINLLFQNNFLLNCIYLKFENYDLNCLNKIYQSLFCNNIIIRSRNWRKHNFSVILFKWRISFRLHWLYI